MSEESKWGGKPLRECSREELEHAVRTLQKLHLERQQESIAHLLEGRRCLEALKQIEHAARTARGLKVR